MNFSHDIRQTISLLILHQDTFDSFDCSPHVSVLPVTLEVGAISLSSEPFIIFFILVSQAIRPLETGGPRARANPLR
jgi:hypothetical protein